MSSITVTKNDLINELLQFETYFSDNDYNPRDQKSALKINHSSVQSGRLLFCAPHALNHYRNNNLKIADVFTGSLCQLLATKTSQPGLISTCPNNQPEHLGFGCEYINHIKDAVENKLMIVDIHGMSDKHNFDICIGTGPNPSDRTINFADKLVSELSDYKISINYPFNAKSEHTITHFVQTKLSGDSIQIEITSRLRRPDNDGTECKLFLEKITTSINKYL